MRILWNANESISKAAKQIALDNLHFERIMICPSPSEVLKVRDIILDERENARIDKIWWNGRSLKDKSNNAELFCRLAKA